MLIFLTVVTGLVIGSFLNVCIYRMPESKSIIMPRSYCPRCKAPIRWYDNVPVISYLLLGGRCRSCGGKISPRYIIVEVLTAAVFALLICQLGLHITTVIFMALSCAMIAATFIDFEHQIIPDEITYGGMVLGLVLSFCFPQLHGAARRLGGLLSSTAGLLTGGVMIYLIGVLGKIIFKKEAMGGGDVKYLAMIGAFLGYRDVILIFFLAPFFGSIVGIIAKLKYKHDVIPYGPYLSLASVIVIIWGDRIFQRLFPYIN